MTVPQDVKLARHAGDLDDDGHDTIGTTWKSPCRAATTANITIATALNNGDSLDGVTLATGDRVLVKNQSTGAQNGIYVVGAAPARATDYDSSVDIVGSVIVVTEGTTNADTAWQCTTNATITVGTTTLVFAAFGGGSSGAPTTADYLVGTADAGLSAEIVVGTTPGGELGNTWASPTVDTTHSGSSHAATQAAAEATAAAALAAHVASSGSGSTDHLHLNNLTFSGDGSTTAFELPAAPFDAYSVGAFVAGVRLDVTLSGTMLTTMTFASAPASGTDNITVDLVAVAA